MLYIPLKSYDDKLQLSNNLESLSIKKTNLLEEKKQRNNKAAQIERRDTTIFIFVLLKFALANGYSHING